MQIAKTYRYTLKEGQKGHDVWALQINVNASGLVGTIAEDGAFGPKTTLAIKRLQDKLGLAADGIAGPVTQRSLALRLIARVETKYSLPKGLIRGIVEGESGFMVGAVNWSVAGGVDCGWTQRRVIEQNYDEDNFRRAFHGPVQFDLLAAELRREKDRFYGKAGAKTHRRAWELAILDHNWPYAAQRLAEGKCIYLDCAKDTRFAQWVADIGVPGVDTPQEWAKHYVNSKIGYVTEWPA
jgi:hypothetical protein